MFAPNQILNYPPLASKTETLKCSSCGDALEGEEVLSPRKDRSGSLLCDECFENEYTYRCPICEELFDEEFNTKISPKYLLVLESVGAEVGLAAGIYEIIKYPFYADGLIELQIFKGAVKRIYDVPKDIGNGYTLSYLCNNCMTKIKQESDMVWNMRWT